MGNPTKHRRHTALGLAALALLGWAGAGLEGRAGAVDVPRVINPDNQQHYVDRFNTMEPEPIINLIPNAQSWAWMKENVPMFECPDKDLEEMYYFRWWSFRKSIKRAVTLGGGGRGGRGAARGAGGVDAPATTTAPAEGLLGFTEFLAFNPGGVAIGHHIREARWIHNGLYADQDLTAELRGANGIPRDRLMFSNWTIWAMYQRYLVNMDKAFVTGLLDEAIRDYQAWEIRKLAPEGVYWQYEVREGMEDSINGDRKAEGRRVSISSYMYGNAQALADIATLAGKPEIAATYRAKAESIKQAMAQYLWDPDAKFFKSRWVDGTLAEPREGTGLFPWYFEIPDKGKGYEVAWAQAVDPMGFWAPMGFTTAERRAPDFRTHGSGHSCEWDGAIWPFTSSMILSAMANVLNDYPQDVITKDQYLEALRRYAISQHKDGLPYIGEYLDETDGRWLRDDLERGRHYNQSSFCDLIISGLVGLHPRADDVVEVSPLVPAGKWDFFCLDNVLYHGQVLTILWDRTGQKYGKGAGFTVLANGRSIAHAAELGRVTGTLAK